MPHYEPSENLLFVENVNLSQHFLPEQIHWGRVLLHLRPQSQAEAQGVQVWKGAEENVGYRAKSPSSPAQGFC